MDDDDDEICTIPAARLRALDVVIVVVDGIGSILGAIESVFEDLTRMMCMHSNWRNERERLAREMQESIERITQE